MRPRLGYATFPSGTPLAFASVVPVPNVPSRDSGSGNFGKSSSLCEHCGEESPHPCGVFKKYKKIYI
ncbi:hypothetical protein EHQ55_08965 [Leptospira meyeri]|nr:hypothetical protein EHQ55_08965 [Leptospira meyeri]